MKPMRFVFGFSAPFSAFGFWLGRPRLWICGLIPLVLNLALTVGVVYAAYHWGFVPLMDRLGPVEGLWSRIIHIAAGIGIALLLIVAGAFAFVVLATILGAPFYDLMGERIEKEMFREREDLAAPPSGFWRSARFSIAEAARRLAVALPLAAVGFLLGFVPGIGPVLAFVIGGGATVGFLVIDAWSYPLDRRRRPFGAKFTYARRHFSTALGLGLGLLVLYLIPCAWFLVPPLAAIAGTRLYCEMEKEKPSASDKNA